MREYVDAICALLTDSARWTAASKACRERILDGFTIRNMVNYFEEEFSRLTEDSKAMEQRRRVAEALNLCAPIAAETFMLEMQLQKMKDELQCLLARDDREQLPLWRKALRELKDGGLKALLKKTIRWIREKVR